MAEMDIHEVLAHLPQRFPMLMVDRITEFEPDKRIVALKNASLLRHLRDMRDRIRMLEEQLKEQESKRAWTGWRYWRS